MGGHGSGSWYRWSTKLAAEDCRAIDVTEWHRKGLRPDAWLTMRWFRGEQETGSIGAYLVGADGAERVSAAVLIYTAGSGPEAEDIRESVPLDWTPCRFGGARPWFLCPGLGCGRRVGKLYCHGRYFVCRHCLDLTYESRREPAHTRALHRAQAIRERLGGSMSMLEPFPEKPKGMHWRTYERLQLEHDIADGDSLRLSAHIFEGLQRRLAKLGS
jgi:hypothetical protein